MKIYTWIITLIVMVTFTQKIISQTDTTKIIILHTNDIHAKIDNFPKLAYIIKEYRQNNENVFLISAGDLFTGNPIVDQYDQKGLPMIELMNKTGFDISCIGNHEFDYGQKDLVNLMKKSDFPYICANIHTSDQSDLKFNKAYSKLYTKDSISIGLLGLIQIEDNHLPATNPLNLYGLSFDDPLKTVKKYKTYKDSSDIFIALTHIGYEQDSILAQKNPYFDAIIGGHSHTKLINGKNIDNTIIVQADSYLDYVGVLTLTTVNHKIVSKEASLIDLRTYKPIDNEVSDMVKTYNKNNLFDAIIGKAEEDIKGKNELGSLMTDAMQDTLKTNISFVNEGGIRLKIIPQGTINVKQMYQLSPFGNTYVILKLKPSEIKKLIEYTYRQNNENDLQVSGILIDIYANEQNQLKNIVLKTDKGEKLKNKQYTVAVNNYMAASYKLKFLKKGIDSGVIDAQSTINYIEKKENINYKGVKRITIIK